MATVLKCKMCGGDIAVSQNMTVGTCLFCGSTMTLPRIDSDKKARLFNRANQYRLNNEFDKAYDAYEAIVAEDESEAEAYWGLVLSEYGVEYVEDPRTKKRKPTCHRTIVKPVCSSVNYERALQYADAESGMMYRDEAEELDRIQRRIIALSAKEDPFDVFICYKETNDETGERTVDSVLAQEIYDELERQGIRAFFARVTLEDKLGTDYEPYIFSALKSAKVMLLVTTSGEHCDAVWVKNEWGRFLGMMKEEPGKTIIPVYRDMTPYELPAELSKYQSQDMGKLGAMQDLLRGVTRLLGMPSPSGGSYSDYALYELIRDHKEDKLERERKRKRKKTAWVITAAIVVLAATAGFFWRQGKVTAAAEAAAAEKVEVRSVPTVAATPSAPTESVESHSESAGPSDEIVKDEEGISLRFVHSVIKPGQPLGAGTFSSHPVTVCYQGEPVTDFTVETATDEYCSMENCAGTLYVTNHAYGDTSFTITYNGESATFQWHCGD